MGLILMVRGELPRERCDYCRAMVETKRVMTFRPSGVKICKDCADGKNKRRRRRA